MHEKKRLLVLIPAFEEEARIGDVVRGVLEQGLGNADIAVVSDGSPDDTAKRAREAGATVIELPVNLGYGAALKAGYTYALEEGYSIVVQLDGDGQHDPVSIEALVRPIEEGASKVVIGSRFLGSATYTIPLVRRIGQSLFAGLLRLLTGHAVTDPTSGYQALHRDVLAMYTSEEFPADFPDADVLLLLHYCGIPFCEVPAQFHGRQDGASMHGGIRSLYYIYKMVLSMFLVACRHMIAYRKGSKT